MTLDEIATQRAVPLSVVDVAANRSSRAMTVKTLHPNRVIAFWCTDLR